MEDFLHALASGGVAPFTVLLVAAVLYWLLVILGALDLDLLHLGGDHGGEAGHDAGHDGPGDGHHSLFTGLFEFLSIGKVPITVILSLLVFSGWSVAMALALLLPLWWPLVLAGGLAAALPITGLACRPLRAVFSALNRGVETGLSLIGREARITSARCDHTFGTAVVEGQGDDLLLDVVAIREDLAFRKDEVVVIADHDPEHRRYLVGPAAYRQEALAERPAPPATAVAAAPHPEPSPTESAGPLAQPTLGAPGPRPGQRQ